MKATKNKSQTQRLLSYLKKNRKGITTMEAFSELGICRLATSSHDDFQGSPSAFVGGNSTHDAAGERLSRVRNRGQTPRRAYSFEGGIARGTRLLHQAERLLERQDVKRATPSERQL